MGVLLLVAGKTECLEITNIILTATGQRDNVVNGEANF